MKRAIPVFLSLLILLSACSKDSSTPGGPGGSTSPYFEYSINNGNVVHVDCSAIKFEATSANGVEPIIATSASTHASFSYAFYGAASSMDTVLLSNHPLLSYSSFQQDEPMHISVKVPQTTGGTDYFYGLAPRNSTHKHTITKRTKGDLENGKRIYWVEGTFKTLAQKLPDTLTATVSGSYRFKLLTIE